MDLIEYRKNVEFTLMLAEHNGDQAEHSQKVCNISAVCEAMCLASLYSCQDKIKNSLKKIA